ncbi:serine/threonine protein kinase, CMGC, dual-specificity [Coemansia sp. RSA 552]|nr:serine/threonine protein kinase, CMGC, dual-specificity [Coemansia sp. RSA 552]
MSRATASNFLNPHLQQRSKSGMFDGTSPRAAADDGEGGEAEPQSGSGTIVNVGAATVSGAATKGRLGRPGLGGDRHYVARAVHAASRDTDEAGSAVPATMAAAGAAGRPRRMTHQATRLTIDPERARAAGGNKIKRVPLTATEPGSAGGQRFLRSPSTSNERQASSSERESGDGTSAPGESSASRLKTATTATSGGAHRPLQAKLETSGKAPGNRGGGTRLPTWRTQQAVRETDDRGSAKRASLAGTTKQAVRESSSQEKSGDEAKGARKFAQPATAQGKQGGAMSSSVSAIGIGSYNSSYQGSRPAGTGKASASVVGVSTGGPSAAAPPVTMAGQGVRSQVASYQQRFGGGGGGGGGAKGLGPSSVVSAGAARTFPPKAAGNTMQAVPMQAPASVPGPASALGTVPSHGSVVGAAPRSQPSRLSSAGGGMAALTPQEAIARYGQQLSAAERTEILDYPQVYYVGNGKVRTGGRVAAYADERGDYIVHMHDHLLYRFELLEVMGKGSFGQVLRVRDHKTGGTAAVKIIRNRKRFHHQAQVEVKLLECLRRWDPAGAHNILQMSGSFHFRGHLCIVMELLSINLYEWLKSHQFSGTPAPLLRHVTVQMLQALQLMAAHRIIHADLKPENVLLARPPPAAAARRGPAHPLAAGPLAADMARGAYRIKVIDLGSSCFETERVYTYIQSRFYRAPEVILGLPYGPGIDMWSLGCIVAEMLTGYPLFPGENEREQLASIVEVLGPPPAYMLERAPRCADFADPLPYGAQAQATPVGGMLLLPSGACVVGSVAIRPYTNSKNKRRRPGARPLDQVLARARDPRLADFVMRTLAWDPAMRLTPDDALRHPWTIDAPMAPPPPPGYVMVPGHPPQPQHGAYMPPQPHHGAYIPPQQPAYGNVARARKA